MDLVKNILIYSLLLVLFVQVFQRKVYRTLTLFFIYILILTSHDFIWLYVSRTRVEFSLGWIYYYWTLEFICCFLRLVVIFEICGRVLRPYPAVWGLSRWLLAIPAGLLFLWTGQTVFHHLHVFRDFVALGLQRMELMQTLLILALFGISVYYRIHLSPFFRWILTGIFLYSAINVVNYEIGTLRSGLAFSVFSFVHQYVFDITSLIWVYALWRYAAIPVTPPGLISQQAYDELSPPVHDRLRELNERLAEMLRQPGKPRSNVLN